MTCEAKVILDSSFAGVRLTTMQLRYPRLVHSEFMTHRVFSRNASSSRAIPVTKVLEQVRNDPAMPCHWGKNQSGMQAREQVEDIDKAKTLWELAAYNASKVAEEMVELGLHKQVANRILEPFQYISVIVTSTSWSNFYELRDHPDADPNIQELAKVMKAAHDASIPNQLDHGTYHLPYIQEAEWEAYAQGEIELQDLVKFSVARCARVSYLTHDKEVPKAEDDRLLYERLVGGDPIHASPTEHQATPYDSSLEHEFGARSHHGNFSWRWTQFRKCLELGRPQIFWEQ